MSKTALFTFFLFALFILPNLSYATSIGVSPRKIEFLDSEKEKQITLYNPNKEKISFAINAENGSFLRFPAKGEIDVNSARTIIVTKQNDEQYIGEAKDKLKITFFNDKKNSLDIITSVSVDVVIHKDASELVNLNIGESKEINIGKAKGWLSASSILTMVAVLIILGVFVWAMVFT